MEHNSEKIRKTMVQAIADYNMLAANDRILVAVSGGKDSTVMLLLLEEIRKRSPFPFTYEALLVDQKQPGFNVTAYKDWLASQGFSLTVLEEDTYSVVIEKTEKGKSYCGLCSRLRRGILYTYAHKHGFTKIALGHHRDDLNATILMNMFYSGTLASMPPKLVSNDQRNTVIRPMCYVNERDIQELATSLKIPLIPCNLCGSQDGLKRQRVKKLLRTLEQEDDLVGQKILAAQANIKPSQLLDKNLWQF